MIQFIVNFLKNQIQEGTTYSSSFAWFNVFIQILAPGPFSQEAKNNNELFDFQKHLQTALKVLVLGLRGWWGSAGAWSLSAQFGQPFFLPCRRRQWQPTPVFLPGEFPWTEVPGGLQSMGSQRVGHGWAAKHSTAQHAPYDTTFLLEDLYPWVSEKQTFHLKYLQIAK